MALIISCQWEAPMDRPSGIKKTVFACVEPLTRDRTLAFRQAMILLLESRFSLSGAIKLDQETLSAYDRHAAAFAYEWETQPTPSDMHELIRRYFDAGPTADIGCGSGRDTEWLNEKGYPTIGYDASESLLAEARRLHPGGQFRYAALPELRDIADETFGNVLCETVIMHLPPIAILPSVKRLMAILRPRGTLYLSWRVTEGEDKRDERGRLYSAFDPALVFKGLASEEILFDDRRVSASSGKSIQCVIARKLGALARESPNDPAV
jgi:SAM-dependent methyltransferase